MPFQFTELELHGVILVEATAFGDARGCFMETYRRSIFEVGGVRELFVQDNYSHSRRGVLRGLHYQQYPMAQGKLIGVVRGEIFDVAVDIRPDSTTFKRWTGVTLSGDNCRMLYVPEGFAHGFCALSETADVVYKTTAEYSPELEGGIRWDDPQIDIHWPVTNPILSRRDAALPLLVDSVDRFIFREGR